MAKANKSDLGLLVQSGGSYIGPTSTENISGLQDQVVTVAEPVAGLNFDKGLVAAQVGDMIRVQTEDQQQQVLSGDGAIAIKSGKVWLTKGSIAAVSISAPTAGDDDGKELIIQTITAYAHVVTGPTNCFNGNLHIATWTAAVANWIRLVAYNGKWYDGGKAGVALT